MVKYNRGDNMAKKRRRRRLPNGFGQITEIKNRNLRNPFRAMVTVGKDSNGKPICKLLEPKAYFRTYNDAYAALLEYNQNPYDVEKDITVQELYDRWAPEYLKPLSISSVRMFKATWAYCEPLYDMKVADVRARHIKGCMDAENVPDSLRSRIKSVFNLLLDYALEYEIVDRNYSRSFNMTVKPKDEEVKLPHIPFSDEEMNILWRNVYDLEFVDVILIQCYSGWRPQEMCLLTLDNINLEEGSFVGGIKTEAGINRAIPIHSRIRHLVERKYKETNSNYLLGKKFTYGQYRYRFDRVVKKLNLNPAHRPHDPRMHFITTAKRYKVDEYAIKYMVGHAIDDLTEKVYTKRDMSWLKEEIENIK